jgi:thiol-disulfide isomerase/thioredoxin
MGLVGARLGFIALYWQNYDTLWSWLDIRDRGFEPLAGLAIAAIYLAWRLWRFPVERLALASAAVSGVAAWSLAAGMLVVTAPQAAGMPSTPLTSMNGTQHPLSNIREATHRQPMVVNLWASWCPPCRREMPVLEQAQQERDDVTFVFINQGESLDTLKHFMQQESLALDNVFRDPHMAFGQEVGAMAMPTTLYYDATGTLIDTHFGELSRATLARSLERFEP